MKKKKKHTLKRVLPVKEINIDISIKILFKVCERHQLL